MALPGDSWKPTREDFTPRRASTEKASAAILPHDAARRHGGREPGRRPRLLPDAGAAGNGGDAAHRNDRVAHRTDVPGDRGQPDAVASGMVEGTLAGN